MSDELKPCPFCGADVDLVECFDEGTREDYWRVLCRGRKCISPDYAEYSDVQSITAAWNTRPVEDTLRAELNRVAVFLAVHGVEGYTIEPHEAAE